MLDDAFINRRFSRRQFGGLSLLAMLTGSKVFGVPTERPVDEDYLCLGTKDDAFELADDGWEVGGSLAEMDNPEFEENGFVSLKRDGVNVIFTASETFAEKWIKAHDHCVREPQPDKPSRIKVFRHYLYGESLNGEPAKAAKAVSQSP